MSGEHIDPSRVTPTGPGHVTGVQDAGYIDITPTWSGLLPAMLAANANMTRQIASAAYCDGREEGWCSVHDSTYDEPIFSDSKCHVNSNEDEFYEWREGIVKALSDLNGEFRRMAEAADLYNEITKPFDRDDIHSVTLPSGRVIHTTTPEEFALDQRMQDRDDDGYDEQQKYEEGIERQAEQRNRDYDDGIIHEDDH
jgi:hypothetical protein